MLELIDLIIVSLGLDACVNAELSADDRGYSDGSFLESALARSRFSHIGHVRTAASAAVMLRCQTVQRPCGPMGGQ